MRFSQTIVIASGLGLTLAVPAGSLHRRNEVSLTASAPVDTNPALFVPPVVSEGSTTESADLNPDVAAKIKEYQSTVTWITEQVAALQKHTEDDATIKEALAKLTSTSVKVTEDYAKYIHQVIKDGLVSESVLAQIFRGNAVSVAAGAGLLGQGDAKYTTLAALSTNADSKAPLATATQNKSNLTFDEKFSDFATKFPQVKGNLTAAIDLITDEFGAAAGSATTRWIETAKDAKLKYAGDTDKIIAYMVSAVSKFPKEEKAYIKHIFQSKAVMTSLAQIFPDQVKALYNKYTGGQYTPKSIAKSTNAATNATDSAATKSASKADSHYAQLLAFFNNIISKMEDPNDTTDIVAQVTKKFGKVAGSIAQKVKDEADKAAKSKSDVHEDVTTMFRKVYAKATDAEKDVIKQVAGYAQMYVAKDSQTDGTTAA